MMQDKNKNFIQAKKNKLILAILAFLLLTGTQVFSYISNNNQEPQAHDSIEFINNSKIHTLPTRTQSNIFNNSSINIEYDSNMTCSKDVLELDAPKNKNLTGGAMRQKNPEKISDMQDLVKFAITNQKIFKLNNNKTNHTISEPNNIKYGCVTTQVVAGMKYEFDLKYKKNKYHAEIWRRSWIKNGTQLTEFKKIDSNPAN